MIRDAILILSENQAITATEASTNEIDFGAAGLDIGKGNPIYLELWLDTAFTTSANTLTVALQDGTDGTTYTTRMTILEATATSSLLAANVGLLRKFSLPNDLARYIRLYYTVSAALAAGKVNAFLTIG